MADDVSNLQNSRNALRLMIVIRTHVVGRICQEEGWKCCHVRPITGSITISAHFLQYNGEMTRKARDETLCFFRDGDSDVRIMIASLKCGGTGQSRIHG